LTQAVTAMQAATGTPGTTNTKALEAGGKSESESEEDKRTSSNTSVSSGEDMKSQ